MSEESLTNQVISKINAGSKILCQENIAQNMCDYAMS